MLVVADSTPLISLSAIGRLDLLRILYGGILIPEAVYREVVVQGRGRPGAREVSDAGWIQRRDTGSGKEAPILRNVLGPGETEVICLAQEIAADLVIMDDFAGRAELARRSFQMIGAVGVLQQAKLQRLIATLKPELDALISHGFYLSQRVCRASLAAVGE